jgi:hypothetical protein
MVSGTRILDSERPVFSQILKTHSGEMLLKDLKAEVGVAVIYSLVANSLVKIDRSTKEHRVFLMLL